MAASAWTPVDETATKWTPVDESAITAKPEKRSLLDRLANDPNDIPLDSTLHATERGLANIGKGAAQFVQGTGQLIRHPIDTVKGMVSGVGNLPEQAAAIVKDPPTLGEVGDVAGETAGQLATGVIAGEAAGAAAKAGAGVAKTAASAAKPTLQTAGKIVRSADADMLGMASPRAAHALRVAQKVGKIAEKLGGESSEAAPVAEPIDSIADRLAEVIAQDRQRTLEIQSRGLGELPATGAKSAAETGEALATKPTTVLPETPSGGKASAPRFTQADRARAQQLLSDSLQQHTDAVVDNIIPREGGTYGANLHTRAAVDFHLQRADIAGAEQALDQGAKQANPSWQPMERQPVPSTNEIRARIQADAAAPKVGTRADFNQDQQIEDTMRFDLQKHEWAAASEARREFIARNSTGMTKGELARRFAANSGKETPVADSATTDLTDVLQQSLDEVRKKRGQK